MSGRLQFRVSYSEVEDRLVLSGTFADNKELKLWLTRRLTLGFLMLAEKFSGATAPAQNPAARSQIAAFERDAATQTADRQSPYEGGEPHEALGDAPILVNRITIAPAERDRVTLNIGLVTGKQVSFPLPRKTFYAVWDMIAEIVRVRTGWTEAASKSMVAAKTPAQPRILH